MSLAEQHDTENYSIGSYSGEPLDEVDHYRDEYSEHDDFISEESSIEFSVVENKNNQKNNKNKSLKTRYLIKEASAGPNIFPIPKTLVIKPPSRSIEGLMKKP